MQKSVETDASQWVILCDDEYLQSSNDDDKPHFCKLRHPRTGSCAMFLFSHSDKKVAEVTQFKEEFRSWFINQTVQEDGSLYITTDVNPAFLILPYLMKEEKSGKFKPLDQVVIDDDYPECHRLCSCEDVSNLDHFCDVKGPEDFKVYRFNKDKALLWLRLKVEYLAAQLESEKFNVRGSAQSETYVKSQKSHVNKDEYLHYAHGLLSEYLPEMLSQQLKEYMGIKDPVIVHNKPALDEPKSKRAKTGSVVPTDDYSNGITGNHSSKPVAKLTAKQKQLSKVDKSGMKSISSFFSRQPSK